MTMFRINDTGGIEPLPPGEVAAVDQHLAAQTELMNWFLDRIGESHNFVAAGDETAAAQRTNEIYDRLQLMYDDKIAILNLIAFVLGKAHMMAAQLDVVGGANVGAMRLLAHGLSPTLRDHFLSLLPDFEEIEEPL